MAKRIRKQQKRSRAERPTRQASPLMVWPGNHALPPYDQSSLLFTEPSFWRGVGSALDIGGMLVDYTEPLSGAQADLLAMASDYRALVGDFRRARARFNAALARQAS